MYRVYFLKSSEEFCVFCFKIPNFFLLLITYLSSDSKDPFLHIYPPDELESSSTLISFKPPLTPTPPKYTPSNPTPDPNKKVTKESKITEKLKAKVLSTNKKTGTNQIKKGAGKLKYTYFLSRYIGGLYLIIL